MTADGALIEIEEVVPTEKARAAARAASTKDSGGNAKVDVEKAMVAVHEIETKLEEQEKELPVFQSGEEHGEHGGVTEDDDEDDDRQPEVTGGRESSPGLLTGEGRGSTRPERHWIRGERQ